MPKFRKRTDIMAMVLTSLMVVFLAMPAFTPAASLPIKNGDGAPAADSQVEIPATSGANPPLTVIDGRIGRQPIYNVLVGCGIAPAEVLSLTRSFKGIFDFRKAQPKDEYQVCLTSQKKLKKLTYKTSLTHQYVAVKTDSGAFHTYRREISPEIQTVARTFTIDSSLYQAITGQGENGSLVAAFGNIFSWDIDFYLFRKNTSAIRALITVLPMVRPYLPLPAVPWSLPAGVAAMGRW